MSAEGDVGSNKALQIRLTVSMFFMGVNIEVGNPALPEWAGMDWKERLKVVATDGPTASVTGLRFVTHIVAGTPGSALKQEA